MATKAAQKGLTTQFMSITGVSEKSAVRVSVLPGVGCLLNGKNDG
jgi:hypothetical protein